VFYFIYLLLNFFKYPSRLQTHPHKLANKGGFHNPRCRTLEPHNTKSLS